MADIDKTLPNTRPEDELIKEQMEEVEGSDEEMYIEMIYCII